MFKQLQQIGKTFMLQLYYLLQVYFSDWRCALSNKAAEFKPTLF